MDGASQLALAYALTTTAGLRGFLTLLAAAIATHAGWIHPAPAFAWLGSAGAIGVLAVFSLLELLGDKIPAVDHALHSIYFAVRPLAGAILVGDTVHTGSQTELYLLMAAGALNALVVHGSSAAVRATSTVTTMSLANAPLSFVEDALAIGGIVLAFLAPVLAAVLAALLVAFLIVLARATYMRFRARSSSA
ncbi:MAG TPA: DUF4126 domain-containing protein [Candidatus Tumulicola sp.]|nr:DUF4126 domain-containing protein [Candidatus Tumulicola sp.]